MQISLGQLSRQHLLAHSDVWIVRDDLESFPAKLPDRPAPFVRKDLPADINVTAAEPLEVMVGNSDAAVSAAQRRIDELLEC